MKKPNALLVDIGVDKGDDMGMDSDSPAVADSEYKGIAARLRRALEADDDARVAAILKRVVADCMNDSGDESEGS